MKHIMNITTCGEDLNRFADRQDLENFFRTYELDGLEVLQAGIDERQLIDPEHVIGVHLRQDTYR